MPGLTFIHRPGAGAGADAGASPAAAVRAGLAACRYDARYSLRRLVDAPDRVLVSAAYGAYPVAAFETPDHRFVLEGRCYGLGPGALEAELSRLARLLFAGRRAPVREWLLRTDGAFLFFAQEKAARRWVFLNDALGRLPVYVQQAERAFFLSRCFPFFAQRENGPRPDSLGLAQQLAGGFPLGERTLLDGVRRLPPAALVRGTAGRPRAEVTRVHRFGFGQRRHRHRALAENAEALAERFRASCVRRSDPPNVLALSGGLDSRAVAFALRRAQLPFERLTFRRPGGANGRDADAAEAIARQLHVPGATLALAPAAGRHCARLLRATGGLNRFDVAYVVGFLERARRHLGRPAHLLTGDGSVPLRPTPRPPRRARGPRALARHLIGTKQLPLPAVARLTGVAEEQIVDSFCERLAAYPAARPAQQCAHFAVFERLFKFSFVGEDRNRHYFWTSAPFYGLPFFRYALHCPEAQKAHFALFRKMLLRLSPRALDVGYPDFLGWKMTAPGYRTYAFLRAAVRRLPALKRFLERVLGRRATPAPGAALRACLRRQRGAPAVAGVLDADALRRLLERPGQLAPLAWANLFTATSFLEWQRGGPSSVLDENADVPLP